MEVCFGNNSIGYLLTLIEIIISLALLYLYLSKIREIYQNGYKDNFEKLDLFIIFLSVFLLICCILGFIMNFYLFSVLITILKFSINTVIQCLLLGIFLWKYSYLTNIIINYFLGTIIIADLIFFFFAFLQYSPFTHTECKAFTESMVNFLSIFFNCVIYCAYFYYRKNEENENMDGLTYSNSMKEDEFSIAAVYHKYDSNIKTIMNSYLRTTSFFFIGFCIDIYFYFKSTSFSADDTHKDNYCVYYGNYNNSDFGTFKFVLCFCLFIIRDILPVLYIYLTEFVFKPQELSKSSSFIEAL